MFIQWCPTPCANGGAGRDFRACAACSTGVSDHPEQFGIGVAASVCAAVVHIRDIAAPLRAAVGWNVAIGGVGSMLPSTVLFVDAHLSALLALLLGSLLLQRLGKAALGSKNAVLEAPPSAAKVKKE